MMGRIPHTASFSMAHARGPMSVRRPGEEGVALMVVLLFVLLLSAIVMEYAYEAQVEASLAANTKDEFQAYVAAKSAVAGGMGLLATDLLSQDLVQRVGMPAKPPAGSPTPGDQDYDSLQDVWAEGIPYQPINDAAMQCTIVDECGKLNLNALMMNERDPNAALAAVLSALFKNLKVEEDPTDAILDWIDPDDDTRGNSGAESDYYGSFETPYACKNGPMDSIEELLLVRGITPELYFDCNMAPDERESRLGENRKPVSLPDLLTVRGHPRGKINVNTARPELLEAIVEAFSGNPGAIDAIIEAQYQAPFQSLQDFTSRAGLGGDATAMQNLIDVKSTMFRIWGDGWANDAMVRVEAVVFRAGRDILSQQPQQLAQPPRSGQNPPQQQMEMFRILDWKVIK